jgi:hypothetical protein
MRKERSFSMKKIGKNVIYLTIFVTLAPLTIAYADSVLEYLVNKKSVPADITQYVAIKNDQLMVKGAGGDKNLDLLYCHATESILIIDHSKQTLVTVNEEQVDQINQQAQKVQPLLNGLGRHVAKLSPEQRNKWQDLIGDSVSLDSMAKTAKSPEATRLLPLGISNVNGFRCRKFQVLEGTTPLAEICLADASGTKISENDAATIYSAFHLYDRLINKGQDLVRQLGLILPNINAHHLIGIPVKFQDLSPKDSASITLHRINTSTVSPEMMQIPRDYKSVPLTIWP